MLKAGTLPDGMYRSVVVYQALFSSYSRLGVGVGPRAADTLLPSGLTN